jgi:Uma2 family endonuclease
MGMAAPAFFTAEMVRALPNDGKRYETVHGELLMTPSPRVIHQLVQARLFQALANWLAAHPVGVVLSAPADISWSPDILVQPDLFVALADELRSQRWSDVRALIIAVEILSPSTTRQDRFTKRRLYQEVGVPVSWFVDCDERYVEVWTPATIFPVLERETIVWHPIGAPEPCTIQLDQIFKSL